MMFAETDEIEAEFVGQHGFVDDVADHLRMRKHCAASVFGDVAKGIQSECERCSHRSGLCREDGWDLVDGRCVTRARPEMLGFRLSTYRHIPRIRAPMSTFGPCAAVRAAPAAAFGQAVRSNRWTSCSGMKRLREA